MPHKDHLMHPVHRTKLPQIFAFEAAGIGLWHVDEWQYDVNMCVQIYIEVQSLVHLVENVCFKRVSPRW